MLDHFRATQRETEDSSRVVQKLWKVQQIRGSALSKARAFQKMKLPGQLVITEENRTATVMIAPRNMSTILTQMVAVYLKIGRKILIHLRQNRKKEVSIAKKISTIKQAVGRDENEAAMEAQANHCVACIMKNTQTTQRRIYQFS
jgi:hypothetical protein